MTKKGVHDDFCEFDGGNEVPVLLVISTCIRL